MGNLIYTPEELETEVWKPIPGFEGLYDISSLGRVRRFQKKNADVQYLTPGNNGTGYKIVFLYKNGTKYKYYVHKLVLLAFVGPCPEGYLTDHKDTVRHNNRLDNLVYVTPKQNLNNILTVQKRMKYYKPVIVYDKDMNAVKAYDSISSTAKDMNTHSSRISYCVHNKDARYKGYYFRLKNEE